MSKKPTATSTAASAPSMELHGMLHRAFDFFNERLFDNALRPCMITIRNDGLSSGYFSKDRFSNNEGEKISEIAMNASWFSVEPLPHILSVFVHELSHYFQAEFGSPGRGRYHNSAWGDLMESIGLMPSSTGEEGGARVGDRMSHYIIPDGKFIVACNELLETENFALKWYDSCVSIQQLIIGQRVTKRIKDKGGFSDVHTKTIINELGHRANLQTEGGMVAIDDGGAIKAGGRFIVSHGKTVSIDGSTADVEGIDYVNEAMSDGVGRDEQVIEYVPRAAAAGRRTVERPKTPLKNKSNRDKYGCGCGVHVWGKPGLSLICGECHGRFRVFDEDDDE